MTHPLPEPRWPRWLGLFRPSPQAKVERARALARRYFDARLTWTAAHEDEARALRAEPTTRAIWGRALIAHRVMVHGDATHATGLETRRRLDLLVPRRTAQVPRFLAPLAIAAATLLLALVGTTAPPEEDLRARGMGSLALPEPQVGLGVGGITEDDREYEILAAEGVSIADWLRFSYTNERADLTHLFVFGLQPDDGGLRPIAPLPEEHQSVAIHVARFAPLPFETRVAARHQPGRLRLVALFTTRALTLDEVSAAVAAVELELGSRLATTLPSILEATLRARLALTASDVVQVLDSEVVANPVLREEPR